MAATVDIGTLIDRKPGVRGGRPIIAGTGVSVRRIAQYSNMGYSPEEIAAQAEHISLAQVHAALTYYFANKEEIDADIAQEKAIADELEQQYRRY